MNAIAPRSAESVAPMREDLRLAAVLGVAAALATGLLFPYLLQTMPAAFAKLPLPLPLVIVAQMLQAGLLLTLIGFLGLRMRYRAGLRLPWLCAWMRGEPLPVFPWRSSVVIGVAAALAVIGLSLLLDPLLPQALHAPAAGKPGTNALTGLLASFYGGIAEELQLRLFLMTLLLWLSAKLGRRAPGGAAYWSAIVFAALLFGLGHLPAAAQVWPLDGIVVLRTVLLNAVAGIAFGWLYWKRGLETAIVAHFSADIVLHVLAPLLSAAI